MRWRSARGKPVLWLVLRRGLIQIAIGVAIGLTGAMFASKALGSLLVEVTPRTVTFAGI